MSPARRRAADVARGMIAVEWRDGHRVLLIPGISCRDGQGVPDVMRGEETQIFGAVYRRWRSLPAAGNP